MHKKKKKKKKKKKRKEEEAENANAVDMMRIQPHTKSWRDCTTEVISTQV